MEWSPDRRHLVFGEARAEDKFVTTAVACQVPGCDGRIISTRFSNCEPTVSSGFRYDLQAENPGPEISPRGVDRRLIHRPLCL